MQLFEKLQYVLPNKRKTNSWFVKRNKLEGELPTMKAKYNDYNKV
jgi:hypothetical protein